MITVSTSSSTLVTHYNQIQTLVRDVLGTGEQGYGLTIINSSLRGVNQLIRASDWNLLRADLAIIQEHTRGTLLTITSATTVTNITATVTNAYAVLAEDLADTVTNRFNCAENQYYVDATTGATNNFNSGTVTRTLPWGLLSDGTSILEIQHKVRFQFVNRLTAVYFFNQGSYLTWKPYHLNNGVSGIDNAWASFINYLNGYLTANPLKYNRTRYMAQNPNSTSTVAVYNSGTLIMSVAVYKYPNEHTFDFIVKYGDTDSSVLTVSPIVGAWIVEL